MLFDDGQSISDVCEVDRFLGEGAFAEVYRVKHKFLGRQAAKVFKSPSASLDDIEQTLSEAIILSRIGHPNIIRVFDAGITKTRIGQCGYFTMEYVAGGSLDSFWRSYGSRFVPITESVGIIRQVCTGLAVAHTEQPPIIHRDIKPQNILVGYDTSGLRIRIADFGLAKKANPLTLLASAKGTPAFKPPESLANMDSCATDVFAVGATLYLLLTDRLPFPIDSRMDFSAGKCWNHPLIPASRFNICVDPILDSIVSRALELKAADRFPDAGTLLGELANWAPSEPPGKKKEREKDADEHKSAMGLLPPTKQDAAEEMMARAFDLSHYPGKLVEAADALEEALNKSPTLRSKYEYQLRLWRRGIAV